MHLSLHVPQINASGAGLLLGAALCVVLPEGFGTFWEAQVSFVPTALSPHSVRPINLMPMTTMFQMLHEEGSRYSEWIPGFVLLLGFLAMLGLQIAAETLHGSIATKDVQREGDDDGSGEATSLLHQAAPKPKQISSSMGSSEQALYGLVVHSGTEYSLCDTE